MSEFEPILHDYLQVWDGETNKEVIFDLIALQKPLPYHSKEISSPSSFV